MKKLLLFIIFTGVEGVTLADDADLFTVAIQPDVLIIFDVSGSMTWNMDGDPTWGDGSEDYPGHDTDGDGYCNDSRFYILKGAVRRIISRRPNFRWGFETFPGQEHHFSWWNWYADYPACNQFRRWEVAIPWRWRGRGYENGDIRVAIAEGEPGHLQQIYNWVDNTHRHLELRADGGTPIGGALFLSRQFLTEEIRRDIQNRLHCRRYFNLLLTDGEETGYPWNNPHNPFVEVVRLRNVVVSEIEFDIQTYVVGVGMVGSRFLDSLAKLGGTNRYYPATSPSALDSILDVISLEIEQKSFMFAAPEVPAVRSKYYNSIYFASFIPSYEPFWRGFLKAYKLNRDGTFPQDTLGNPLHPPLWEAGEQLKLMSIYDRRIYTEKGGILVPFTPFYVNSTDLDIHEDSVELLINYVRGNTPYDWKLGDIFHSYSVCVGPPSPNYYDEGYDEFKINNAHRNKLLIVGSNDGMLHAFEAGTYVALGDSFTDGTGRETWAFIPNDLLPKLKHLTKERRYYVDGSPVVFDGWFPSGPTDNTKEANEWKTVLIIGERQGGNYYSALDITVPCTPEFLWQFTDEHLGQTWSTPGIGKVKIAGRERWVAVIGGGYNKEIGYVGRAMYVLDVTNGSIIWKFTDANLTYSVPAAPSSIDRDNDGFIDYVYIGDIGGQLWKLDVKNESVSEWQGYRIFVAQQEQPMYYPPTCAFDKNWNLWLFFGGGDRDSVLRRGTFNKLYGMKDKGQTTPFRDADLANVTHGGNVNENGWYIALDRDEKCISKPLVFNEIAYFVTYKPSFDDPCRKLGIGRVYRVVFTTGKPKEGEPISKVIGEGLPTSPQITITSEGNFVVTIGTSRSEIISERVPVSTAFKRIISWREIKGY